MESSDRDRLTVKNVSYLRARDPSILAFNWPDLAQVRTNLIADLESETVLSEPKNDNIRVYLRIKKIHDVENLYKIEDNTLVCNVPPNSTCMRNMREGESLKKMYTFTKIFHPETTQTEIFNNVVKPKILDFINGHNSTLLTYGASGSGKTFTVIGTDEEPGVLPRSLEYLFRTLPQLTKSPLAKPLPAGNVVMLGENDYKKEKMMRKNLLNSSSLMDRNQHINTYRAMQQRLSSEPAAQLDNMMHDVSLAVWVSFAEIYNEQIYDLLQPNPPRGKQRERLRLGCSSGHNYIKNLTNISVTSGLEAYQILQYGIHNLNYASTNLNSHSSRSHSIFTVKLVQVSESDGGTFVSCFNFCDLAGCERTKKTMNVGDRLKESNNINSSLLVLGRCISAIRESQRQNDTKLVPFRESKLTQLFQKALAGHEDIAMIVTISPKSEMFDETQHVLNFSAVAKDIAIDSKAAEKIPRKKGRFSLMAQEKKRKLAETSVLTEESYENDVAYWQNVALLLQSELEQQKSEQEANEKLNTDFIKSEYEKMLKNVEDSVEQRVKDAKAWVKMEYEMRMNKLKAKYERLLNEQVINLGGSDDEENERLREEVKELRQENAKLQIKFQREVDLRDARIMKISDENEKQRLLIDEGVTEVNDLENEIEALKAENEELRKNCVAYQLEINTLKEQLGGFLKRESESENDDQDNVEDNGGSEDLYGERTQKETTSLSNFCLKDSFSMFNL